MFNYLFGATGGAGDTLPLLLMMGGLILVSIFMTVIPQRKRKKQIEEMTRSLNVGAQIKTIGGMVGVIVSIDEDSGLFLINVGTEENPTYITIDKTAVYIPNFQPMPATEVVEEADTMETEESAEVVDEDVPAETTEEKSVLKD